MSCQQSDKRSALQVEAWRSKHPLDFGNEFGWIWSLLEFAVYGEGLEIMRQDGCRLFYSLEGSKINEEGESECYWFGRSLIIFQYTLSTQLIRSMSIDKPSVDVMKFISLLTIR